MYRYDRNPFFSVLIKQQEKKAEEKETPEENGEVPAPLEPESPAEEAQGFPAPVEVREHSPTQDLQMDFNAPFFARLRVSNKKPSNQSRR